MIRARVALLGTGKEGDSFRTSLPTYSMVETDEATGTAIVDIPEDVYPSLPEGTTETITTLPKVGRVVTAASGNIAADSAAHFDEKYKEHAGEYRLDLR